MEGGAYERGESRTHMGRGGERGREHSMVVRVLCVWREGGL